MSIGWQLAPAVRIIKVKAVSVRLSHTSRAQLTIGLVTDMSVTASFNYKESYSNFPREKSRMDNDEARECFSGKQNERSYVHMGLYYTNVVQCIYLMVFLCIFLSSLMLLRMSTRACL